jgi:histidinol-phosphate aminotransferase
VTNGSTPILAAFADWVNVKGGKIITSAITYEGVPRVAEQAGTEVVYMPLTQDMGYDLEAIAAAVGPDTGAVYLCNPNNPTGKTIPTAQLKAFVEDVSNKVPVFVDEAYLDMSDDYPGNVMSPNLSPLASRSSSRGPSRNSMAMAGQRLGYGLDACRHGDGNAHDGPPVERQQAGPRRRSWPPSRTRPISKKCA